MIIWRLKKNNFDDAKRSYFSNNRHDAAGDILLSEARLEDLRKGNEERDTCVRLKRSYEKRSVEYWTEGIVQSHQAKRLATSSTSTFSS